MVNVVTHGFNPFITEATFIQPFETIANELDDLPTPGSALDGRVSSYVPQWDSTSGWAPALVSVAVSLAQPAFAPLALASANLFLNEAASNAEQAAQSIDQEITDPQNDYLLSPAYGQVIDLIGHSRGGAVNARVSQLLTEQGYTVTQYTSLDGFSTDWPIPANILGDISIPGTATATTKVNYEVQQGLAQVLVNWVESIIGQPLGSAEINQLVSAAADSRAPDRAGFQNITIPGTGTGANQFSNHLNIVSLFSDLSSPYIYDSYEGQHLDDPVDTITPDTFSTMSAALVPDVVPNVVAEPDSSYNNFTDGSFESLGSLWKQVQAANIPTANDPLLEYWASQVENPAQLLASTWTVNGDATLVQNNGNTLAQLSLDQGTASIGQYLDSIRKRRQSASTSPCYRQTLETSSRCCSGARSSAASVFRACPPTAIKPSRCLRTRDSRATSHFRSLVRPPTRQESGSTIWRSTN